jgi:hypothetical protein
MKEKKKYEPPKVKTYGSVETLTLNKQGMRPDYITGPENDMQTGSNV